MNDKTTGDPITEAYQKGYADGYAAARAEMNLAQQEKMNKAGHGNQQRIFNHYDKVRQFVDIIKQDLKKKKITPYRIAKSLNEMGVLTVNGKKKWTTFGAQRMLHYFDNKVSLSNKKKQEKDENKKRTDIKIA